MRAMVLCIWRFVSFKNWRAQRQAGPGTGSESKTEGDQEGEEEAALKAEYQQARKSLFIPPTIPEVSRKDRRNGLSTSCHGKDKQQVRAYVLLK